MKRGHRHSEHVERLSILAVGGVWAACAVVYQTIPGSSDQFVFDYMGWRLLVGDVPYRDFVDMNWPGPMWLHALATAAFGNHLWSWHALDLGLFAVSAIAIASVAARIGGREARSLTLMIAPGAYVALAFPPVAGQPDASAGQFLALAVWCHLRALDRRRAGWQIAAGLLVACAVINKPTLIVIAPLLLLHAFVIGHPLRERMIHAATAAVAGAAGLLLAFATLRAQGSTASEILEATITYNVWTQYGHADTLEALVRKCIAVHLGPWLFLTLPASAGFALMAIRRSSASASFALLALAVAGGASFFIQRTGATYHFAPCVLPFAAAASVALSELSRASWERMQTGWVSFWLRGLVVVSGVVLLGARYPGLDRALWHGDSRAFLGTFTSHDGLSVADVVELSVYAARETSPTETLLVAGRTGSVNYLARRRQPTRFFYLPLLMEAKPPLPMRERWNEIFRRELIATPPTLCVVTDWARRNWLHGETESAKFFRALLASEYRNVGRPRGERSPDMYLRRR